MRVSFDKHCQKKTVNLPRILFELAKSLFGRKLVYEEQNIYVNIQDSTQTNNNRTTMQFFITFWGTIQFIQLFRKINFRLAVYVHHFCPSGLYDSLLGLWVLSFDISTQKDVSRIYCIMIPHNHYYRKQVGMKTQVFLAVIGQSFFLLFPFKLFPLQKRKEKNT